MEKRKLKTTGEWWSERSKKSKYLIISLFIGLFIVIMIGGNLDNRKPSACDCIDILNVPTEQAGVYMPLPIGNVSDEDFRKYKKCYEAYSGPASAILKCAGK